MTGGITAVPNAGLPERKPPQKLLTAEPPGDAATAIRSLRPSKKAKQRLIRDEAGRFG